jgi:hypothetical protein
MPRRTYQNPAAGRESEDEQAVLRCPYCDTEWPQGPILKRDRSITLVGCPACKKPLTAVPR